METSASSSAAPPAAPQLREARFSDYEGIMRLGEAYSFAVVSLDDWGHLWTNNPLWERLGKDWPIGWVLESGSGEIVGSFSNVPSSYAFRGEHLIVANSRGWVVAPPYRGLALLLLDEYFNQPSADVCISTTAGPLAFGLLEHCAGRIPVGQWNKVSYWIAAHRVVAKQALVRRKLPFAGALAMPAGAALRLTDAFSRKPLPARNTNVTVEALDAFDARFDPFWRELCRRRPETLLALRDAATLSWHFSRPLREGRLWILTASRNGRMIAYCICKRQPRSPLRAMRLIDYQTLADDVDLLPDLLRVALEMSARNDVGVFENPGRDVPKMCGLDRCAPYVRTLDNWPFFYRAGNERLATELKRESAWDPSVFDGDASLE